MNAQQYEQVLVLMDLKKKKKKRGETGEVLHVCIAAPEILSKYAKS